MEIDMGGEEVKDVKVKIKKEKHGKPHQGSSIPDLPYEEKAAMASVVAQPMATKKLSKKLFKLVRKAAGIKYQLRSGLKHVQAKLRKGETGIVLLAGNVSPIDVSIHLPIVCEDLQIPYAYVPTGKDLGGAMGVKRSTLVVLVRPHEKYQELFGECFEELKCLAPSGTDDRALVV